MAPIELRSQEQILQMNVFYVMNFKLIFAYLCEELSLICWNFFVVLT